MLDRTANTIYDYTRNSQNPYDRAKPSQSYAEQLVSAKLLANATSDAENRKPPIPNIGKTAPRYGYKQNVPTITDMFNADTVYPSRFGDWSGSVSGYGGTAYPSVQSVY